jgi:hypothetical protein
MEVVAAGERVFGIMQYGIEAYWTFFTLGCCTRSWLSLHWGHTELFVPALSPMLNLAILTAIANEHTTPA